MKGFYVNVDMVLNETELRSKQGHLSVQGEMRDEFRRRSIASKVVSESGHGGGNPEVRLFGSRSALTKFLADFKYEGVPVQTYLGRRP